LRRAAGAVGIDLTCAFGCSLMKKAATLPRSPTAPSRAQTALGGWACPNFRALFSPLIISNATWQCVGASQIKDPLRKQPHSLVGIALDQHKHKHKPKPIHKHKPKSIQNWCRASCWRCSIEIRRPQTHSLVKGLHASHIRARIKRTGHVVLLLATALPSKLTDEHELVRSPSEETNQHDQHVQRQKKGRLRCCQGYVRRPSPYFHANRLLCNHC
jgi:hypothetical protein